MNTIQPVTRQMCGNHALDTVQRPLLTANCTGKVQDLRKIKHSVGSLTKRETIQSRIRTYIYHRQPPIITRKKRAERFGDHSAVSGPLFYSTYVHPMHKGSTCWYIDQRDGILSGIGDKLDAAAIQLAMHG